MIIEKILENKLLEAKKLIFEKLNNLLEERLEETKKYLPLDQYDYFDEAVKRNPNIQKIGRIQKIRRRIRRNKKGRIIVQKNVRRSALKGYRISGNTVKRISAAERMRKSRLLKRSWKTTRKSKLRRTLMKRRLSMAKRRSIGLR